MSEHPLIKLYNMEGQEWREGNFQRGDSWRSAEVYECGICGTRTNQWVMGGGYLGMGLGPRHWCEGGAYAEHDDIEKTQEEVAELDTKIKEYSAEVNLGHIARSTRAAARELLARLQTECELLQAKVDRLRALFAKKALHDVEGVDEPVKPIVVFFGSKLADVHRSILED